jgi:hypothetical protein
MIHIKPNQKSILDLSASTRGVAVFLDQWAINDLARRNSTRRNRCVAAVRRGADLLFSVTNAAELTGPQGNSWADMRALLNELGSCWFAVELDPFEVTKREGRGMPAGCCFCDRFLKDYLSAHWGEVPTGQIVGVSDDTFALGRVMDWLAPQRDSIARGKKELDTALINRIKGYRAEHDADPSWLDRKFPAIAFRPQIAATFTYVNLVRLLVLESKSFAMTPGDGIDFCQAVIGSAFASFATLDKKWKRRIEMLPRPNRLARIYYHPELDSLVDDIERALDVVDGRTRTSTLWAPTAPGAALPDRAVRFDS